MIGVRTYYASIEAGQQRSLLIRARSAWQAEEYLNSLSRRALLRLGDRTLDYCYPKVDYDPLGKKAIWDLDISLLSDPDPDSGRYRPRHLFPALAVHQGSRRVPVRV